MTVANLILHLQTMPDTAEVKLAVFQPRQKGITDQLIQNVAQPITDVHTITDYPRDSHIYLTFEG